MKDTVYMCFRQYVKASDKIIVKDQILKRFNYIIT